MGLLINGVWQNQWYDTEKTGGKFEREASNFINVLQQMVLVVLKRNLIVIICIFL